MTAFAQVSAKAEQFAKSTGGAPASQAVTGVGFIPKVLFLATIAGSRTSNGNHNDATITLGVITASGEESAATWGSNDNGATTSTGRTYNSTKFNTTTGGAGRSNDSLADLTSFDTDGFTLNWTTNSANASLINYLAIGGASITSVKSTQLSFSASTGSVTYAHGLGTTPDIIFILHGRLNSDGVSTEAQWGFGVGKSASKQWCLAARSADAAATGANQNASKTQRTDRIIAMPNSAATGYDFEADLVSMDGTNVTLNQSGAAGTNKFSLVSIKGGSWDVGATNKSTGGAPVSQQLISGLTFQPAGALFATYASTSNSGVIVNSSTAIGFGTSSSEEASAMANYNDNVLNSQADQRISNTKALTVLSSGAGPTLQYECDFTSNDSNGVTVNWTTNNGNADEIVWLAFGNAAPNAGPLILFRRRRGF